MTAKNALPKNATLVQTTKREHLQNTTVIARASIGGGKPTQEMFDRVLVTQLKFNIAKIIEGRELTNEMVSEVIEFLVEAVEVEAK